MSNFFSPNSSKTGASLFVSFSSKDGAIFCKFIQQTTWDPITKKGGFQGGKVLNFKLSQDEVGAIIESIRTKKGTSFYHQFDGSATTGSFTYYSIPPKREGDKAKEGFGFKVKKDIEYKVGFTLGSAERLMEFLRFALDHIFSWEHREEKKRNDEFFKAKEAAKNTKQPANPKKNEEADPEDFQQDADEFAEGTEEQENENRDF